MKSAEEIMEILEAYDLTGSFRDAAELAGCSHHTVASLVAARERGELTPGRAERRDMLVDPYREKLEEWVERSRGKVERNAMVLVGTARKRHVKRCIGEDGFSLRDHQPRRTCSRPAASTSRADP